MKKNIFRTNPEKAASKVTINSFMMGSLFFVFTIIWTINPHHFDVLIISQLVLAIPLLFVSSLAYTKVSYRDDVKLWDYLGWHTNTIGNALVLNVVGLLVAKEYLGVALAYYFLLITLMLIYSILNIYLNPENMTGKLYKFFFFIFFLVALGILPSLR
jgi:hypothetical protein